VENQLTDAQILRSEIMLHLSWDDIDARLRKLSLDKVPVWGIPRGGSIVAGLAMRYGAIPVIDPREASIAIDDIIDSGATREKVLNEHNLKTLALVDKGVEGIAEWVHFPWEEPPAQDIASSVLRCLQYLGEDPLRDGLRDTPRRVVASWKELYAGYQVDLPKLLRWFDDPTDEMIISKDIQFYSMCEHHMLPFFGRASIGYIPNGKVIGISKLSRIVETYARRLQTQERLTYQIGQSLENMVGGVAVHITAQHFCMMSRGVNQQHSEMVTNYLTGLFRTVPEARNEFLMAVAK
jgi:GTP cyclohydrolase I